MVFTRCRHGLYPEPGERLSTVSVTACRWPLFDCVLTLACEVTSLEPGTKLTMVLGCANYKNTNHQQMHKESFIINRNTRLHVSTLLGHLQGELFVIVTLRLHFTVE
jgi:hypothetical protein